MRGFLVTVSFSLLIFGLFGQVDIKKDLEYVGGVWVKKGTSQPFTGEYIDKNESGKIIGTGFFKNGIADGKRMRYYDNGNKFVDKTYNMGVAVGLSQEYYENGNLKQSGIFVGGKEEGVWTLYYETGEIHVTSAYTLGVQNGDYVEYSLEGKILEKAYFNNGEVGISPDFFTYAKNGDLLADSSKHKEAIEQYNKAIEINPNVPMVFVNRAVSKQNILDFEGAVKDLDIANSLKPYSSLILAYRGNSKINIYTSKGNLFPSIEETKSACVDLKTAVILGDTSPLTKALINQHCSGK
ncbi:MAG: tetratricopeptide repeat protein [Bacteroidetes bacterium]|nr:tetratricopeptide repeat protein [Bacteroidota bacterium]